MEENSPKHKINKEAFKTVEIYNFCKTSTYKYVPLYLNPSCPVGPHTAKVIILSISLALPDIIQIPLILPKFKNNNDINQLESSVN